MIMTIVGLEPITPVLEAHTLTTSPFSDLNRVFSQNQWSVDSHIWRIFKAWLTRGRVFFFPSFLIHQDNIANNDIMEGVLQEFAFKYG
jgi:hypothetical protein